MPLLYAILLLGIVGSKIPSDAEIAARLEAAIRAQLHPQNVQVTVHRRSSFTTNVERLDIVIDGFTAREMPMGGTSAAPAPASSITPVGDAPIGTPAATPPAPHGKGRQVRIKLARLTCTNFTMGALPVQTMTWEARDVRIPLDSISAGAFTIAAARSTTGSLVVGQEGLTALLRTCNIPLTAPEVTVTPDGCKVSGVTRTFVGFPVQLTGRVTCPADAVLVLANPRLQVSVIPVPGAIAKRILRDINPLTDLNVALALPAPLVITNTTHLANALRFEALLQFPKPEE